MAGPSTDRRAGRAHSGVQTGSGTNREAIDYFLLLLEQMAKKRISLTATSRSRFAAYRCPTMDDALRAVMTNVTALPVNY